MSERVVAVVEPNTTNGVIVNVIVVQPDWVNNDPAHFFEGDDNGVGAIGWEIKNGNLIVPPAPEPVEEVS
jgi:hypothetical protein